MLEDGPYANQPGVEVWGPTKDARLYDGPHPVVAHPPCERWGRYWHGGPSVRVRRQKGDDDGCFAAALDSVRKWGGVLEHPEASHAFSAFGLTKPPHSGGWVYALGGWVCCVEQGHYGHLARKKTWLYVAGVAFEDLPELRWGTSGQRLRLDYGYHSAEERRRAVKIGQCQRLTKRQCAITPEPFRDLLLDLARRAR